MMMVPCSVTTETLPDYLDKLFGKFNAAFADAPFETHRTIAGQTFACRLYDRTIAEFTEAGLAGDTGGQAEPDCRILVGLGGVGGLPFPPVWAEAFFRERALEAVLAPMKYRVHYILEKSFWQFHDLSTNRGIQLMQRRDLYPDWEPGSPLRNFFHWYFGSIGMRLVHAGTLADNGIGILLAGSGGSGKSGTVVAGLLNGLASVGDDYVVVRSHRDITAYPLFTTLKQDPKGYSRLGLASVLQQPAPVNWQGKYQFRISDIPGAVQPGKIGIKALCIPKVTGSNQTRIVPATHKDAFLALAPSGVSQIPADRDKGFAFYAAISRDLPCMVLELGTDPAEISFEIRRVIGRLQK